MLSLFGAGIGRGIVIGKAYVLRNSEIEIPHFNIDLKDTKKEVGRLNSALKTTQAVSYTHLTLPTNREV